MSELLTKARTRFEVKSLDLDARTFSGLASTWDEDLGGDIIHQGAFKNTLKEWRSSGSIIPLIDQHNYGSIRSVVGKLTEAKETGAGLESTFQVIEGPDGDEVLRRIKGGYVDGLSIGYEPVKWEYEEKEESRWGQVRHLKEVKLHEVSVVIWPMNPGATIAQAKAALSEFRDRDKLDEGDRKELRRLNTIIGNLLQKATPADAADAPKGQAPNPPDATPPEADAPKATEDADDVYLYTEALREKLARINLKSIIEEDTHG